MFSTYGRLVRRRYSRLGDLTVAVPLLFLINIKSEEPQNFVIIVSVQWIFAYNGWARVRNNF